MGRPIEFEAPAGPRYGFTIESVEHISGSLKIRKLNKSITNWGPLHFVSYELNRGHRGNVSELCCNVTFIHPWFNITDPKGLTLLLLSL